MQNNFQRIYPGLRFVYYLLILILVFVVKHPLELAILYLAVVISLDYIKTQKGTRDLGQDMRFYILPLITMLIAGLLNFAFRHYGIYTIFTLENGTRFTWDTLVDGGLGGFRLGLCIICLQHMNENLDSNSMLFVFKPLFPTISILLTLTLRFFPYFTQQGKEIRAVNSVKVRESELSGLEKWRNYSEQISRLSSWALESSITTASMMEARGHGINKRKTQYKLYKWRKRDSFILLILFVTVVIFAILNNLGAMGFISYPFLFVAEWIYWNYLSIFSLVTIAILPLIIDIRKY